VPASQLLLNPAAPADNSGARAPLNAALSQFFNIDRPRNEAKEI
jgi:hypothetical protein